MLWIVAVAAFGLATAAVGFMLDLRDKVNRLLKLPNAQPGKITGETPKDRRARFLEASRGPL